MKKISQLKDFDVYKPPRERRYWVVKADAGQFYETFISNSIITIGHLDKFSTRTKFNSPFCKSLHDLKK